MIAAPYLILPPERPAIVRASDIRGLPSFAEMQRRERAVRQGNTFPFPFFVSDSSAAKVLTWRTSAIDASDLTTYNGAAFQGISIGTAAADRYVIVGTWGHNGTRTLSSLTIQGITATQIFTAGGIAASTATAQLCIANVPTGTTADVVVTWSGAQTRCGIGVWSATGLASATPVDKQSQSGSASPSKVLATAGGGFAVGYSGCAAAAPDFTWTNLTERFDQTIETTSSHSGADATTPGTSLTVSGTNGASGTAVFLIASW